MLDVTFGWCIFPINDLVSNRSKIQINLVDENETLLLDDTPLTFRDKIGVSKTGRLKKYILTNQIFTFTKASGEHVQHHKMKL